MRKKMYKAGAQMQVIFIGTGGWISPYTMEPLSILIKGERRGDY